AGNVTTGNIIRGLRLINDVDWTVWFEGVSRIDEVLREKADYSTLDFASRDQYRTAIEELARGSGHSEHEVAEIAVEMAAKSAGRPEMADTPSDVGFYLVGPSRETLEKEIGYRPLFGLSLKRSFRKAGWLGIAVPVFALTALLLYMSGNALAVLGLPVGAIALMLALFAVPASEGALGFFNTVVLLFLKP